MLGTEDVLESEESKDGIDLQQKNNNELINKIIKSIQTQNSDTKLANPLNRIEDIINELNSFKS